MNMRQAEEKEVVQVMEYSFTPPEEVTITDEGEEIGTANAIHIYRVNEVGNVWTLGGVVFFSGVCADMCAEIGTKEPVYSKRPGVTYVLLPKEQEDRAIEIAYTLMLRLRSSDASKRGWETRRARQALATG